MIADISRIMKSGQSLYVLLTTQVIKHTGWRAGDRIAIRPAGDKLILERVPLEQLAKLRTVEDRNGE